MQRETFTILPDNQNLRLDQWCKKHLHAPYPLVQKMIRRGDIRVNGEKADAKMRLSTGMEIQAPILEPAPETPVKTYTPDAKTVALLQKCILFENAHYAVLNKPAGMAVQGGSKLTEHLDALLPLLLKGGEPRLVHRLDKETSGILLVAKTRMVATLLTSAFKERMIQKTYVALVHGRPPHQKGIIEAPLLKKGRYERMAIDKNGDEAITHYRLLRTCGKLTWVELIPLTGRTHQLRAHMASLGTPIVGDDKYGFRHPETRSLPKGLYLHAKRITLPKLGEITEKSTTWEAPLPSYMQQVWDETKD